MSKIPEYLLPYAADMTQKDLCLSFKMKCPCGCETFLIVKNHLTFEEEKQKKSYRNSFPDTGWHTLYGGIDANGKPYSYIRKFFFFKKYIDIPPEPVFMSVNVVKAFCTHCQKETVVFDSRLHGYDSQFSTEEQKAYLPHFDSSKAKSGNVLITIEHLTETVDDPSLFSWIAISVKNGNKKKKVFEMETA